jgi:hypothetical protein
VVSDVTDELLFRLEYDDTVHELFIDFDKAYDSGGKYCAILSLSLVHS